MGLLGVPGTATGRAQPVHDRDQVEQPRPRHVVAADEHLHRRRVLGQRHPGQLVGQRIGQAGVAVGRPEPDDRLGHGRPRPARAASSPRRTGLGCAATRPTPRRAPAPERAGRRPPARRRPRLSACQAGQDSRPGGTRGEVSSSVRPPGTGTASAGRRCGSGWASADGVSQFGLGGGDATGRRVERAVARAHLDVRSFVSWASRSARAASSSWANAMLPRSASIAASLSRSTRAVLSPFCWAWAVSACARRVARDALAGGARRPLGQRSVEQDGEHLGVGDAAERPAGRRPAGWRRRDWTRSTEMRRSSTCAARPVLPQPDSGQQRRPTTRPPVTHEPRGPRERADAALAALGSLGR